MLHVSSRAYGSLEFLLHAQTKRVDPFFGTVIKTRAVTPSETLHEASKPIEYSNGSKLKGKIH